MLTDKRGEKKEEMKLGVPIIILPIHKRNKKSEIISITYGSETKVTDGPNLIFLDSRYKNYEFRTPVESIFVEASFFKNNYLAFTGKKNFKHALESLSKIDSSSVLPLRASPQQCTCGLCKKQTIDNRCAFWKQLTNQRASKNSRANATRLISLQSFFKGKKFHGVCETLIVKEMVFFDNFHSNQKPPQRPNVCTADSYQCSTLIAANGFQFKIPSNASWPRVAITDKKVLSQILSCKYQLNPNNMNTNGNNKMNNQEKNKIYVPVFREKMNEIDNCLNKNNHLDESDPSSSEEIKENDINVGTSKKEISNKEKAKYYKVNPFNLNNNNSSLQKNNLLSQLPHQQDSPKNFFVNISASSPSSKSFPSSSLAYTDKMEECSGSFPIFSFSSHHNEDISLQISAELPFDNASLSIFWCPENENNTLIHQVNYNNVPRKITIETGKIGFFPIKESTATQLEFHLFSPDNKKHVYRVPLLFDILQNSNISKTYALVVCLDKESHSANNSIRQLKSSNVDLFYLVGKQEATKINVEHSLNKISHLLKPNDYFHFYYFGHVHHPTVLCTSDCGDENFMGFSIFSLKKFLSDHPRSFVSLDLGNGLKKYSKFEEIYQDMNLCYNNFFFPLLLAIDQENKPKNKRTKKQHNCDKDHSLVPNKKLKQVREQDVKAF